MTVVLGRADVRFGVQDSAFHRGLNRVQQSATKVADRLDRVGRVAQRMLLVGGAALAGFVKLASDAEEIASKFEAVFKEETKAAREFSVQLARAVGRSTVELQEFLAALQDTFVPMGFTRKKARELSQQLVELGVDVASFQNKAEPDVLRDFQSALVGNVETVRKYGIVITQARIDQELVNMGFKAGAKGATEQQKVMARLNLIMQGTTDAQGDAARTAGSFANQVKAVLAAAKDAGIAIGETFIPQLKEVTRSLIASIPQMTRWVEESRANIKVTTIMGAQLLVVAVVIPKITRAVAALIPVVLTLRGAAFGLLGVASALVAINILKKIHDIRVETEQLSDAIDASTRRWQALMAATKAVREAATPAGKESALKQQLDAFDAEISFREHEIERLRTEAALKRRQATPTFGMSGRARAAIPRLTEEVAEMERAMSQNERMIAKLREQRSEAAVAAKAVEGAMKASAEARESAATEEIKAAAAQQQVAMDLLDVWEKAAEVSLREMRNIELQKQLQEARERSAERDSREAERERKKAEREAKKIEAIKKRIAKDAERQRIAEEERRTRPAGFATLGQGFRQIQSAVLHGADRAQLAAEKTAKNTEKANRELAKIEGHTGKMAAASTPGGTGTFGP